MVKSLLLRIPTARQIHAARVALDWNQQQLADASGVGIATIKRIEFNHRDSDLAEVTRLETLKRIVVALEVHGIEFVFKEGYEGVFFAARVKPQTEDQLADQQD
jgi:transcriptional regulator with XRE-family HTH domain